MSGTKGTIRSNGGMTAVRKALAARRAGGADEVMVQRTLKNGGWGKPFALRTYGRETPEDVAERMNRNNPGSLYRLAE